MLMEDIFEYKIKKVSANKIRKARSIINNYFMSSYIKYDCLIKFTLYLYNPTKLISEEDMKFYKYWISTLNPVFLGKHKIALDEYKTFKNIENTNRINKKLSN